MYSIDYQFQPEQEVYYINKPLNKIGKGKLLNVHILNFLKNDNSIDTIIRYGVHDTSNRIIFDGKEGEVFSTYEEAATALFN